ncbi:hypothetical protein DPMN_079043 [Dreissena polymorpha]|uniref:Uncharacterized protein n=1 Tax=Dreissena polymorpha TaxID=45954 RepID=A0A9D3YSE3_DREPO|nr:hypothetical protein DPMN_079043 [Dreissena polymorpha]
MSNRLGSSSSLSRGGQVHDAPMLSMLFEHLNLTATVDNMTFKLGMVEGRPKPPSALR